MNVKGYVMWFFAGIGIAICVTIVVSFIYWLWSTR